MNFSDVRKYVKGVLTGSFVNKSTLDKLSTSTDGKLLFDNEEISGEVDQVNLSESGSSDNAIKFGIDEDGNYGYYKVGADTVTPFKTEEPEPAYPIELDELPYLGKKFNTDYKVNTNTIIEYNVKIIDFKALQQRFFCIYTPNTSSPSFQLYINGGGNFGYSMSNAGNSWKNNLNGKAVPVRNGEYLLILNNKNKTLKVNDVLYTMNDGTTVTSSNYNLQVMSWDTNLSPCQVGNFKYMKIYEGSTLVRWYVPVLYSKDVYKIYDKINDVYIDLVDSVYP